MNLDNACMYLNISPDDEDLNLDEINRNYHDKLNLYDPAKFSPDSPEHVKALQMRKNLHEAYNFLLEAYSQIYGSNNKSGNNNLFWKLAFLSSLVIILCFAVSAFLFYKYNNQPPTPAPSNNSNEYSQIMRELEQLRRMTQNNNQAPKPAPTPTPAPAQTPANYADLVERVMPSIVLIETDNNSRGSGFFVSAKGDILTNYHVISNAGRIRVTTRDGKKINARVKDFDSENDMALIAIESRSATPFLQISPVLPRQGEAVIAIGNPRGYDGTVSNGIISAFRENNKWVQFTAPISPGSSGGALINLQGQVVGMPTQYRTDGQNLNFAVAPTLLNNFFKTAQNNSRRQPASRRENNTISRNNNNISLPNSRGFQGLRWGASFSSVERAINAELEAVNKSDTLFSINKIYNTFRAKIDVIIAYGFENYRLRSIFLLPTTVNDSIKYTIIKELTDIYGIAQEYKRGNDEFAYLWSSEKFGVLLKHDLNSIIVQFMQFRK